MNDAEQLYGQDLAVDAGHADSLHLLGVVAYQTGRLGLSVEMICRAILVAPAVAVYHCNLGNSLWQQGRADAAVTCYRRALDLDPECPEAHNNLGAAAMEQGRPDAAVVCYRRALSLKPDYPDAYCNLGNALREQGHPDAAAACYLAAIHLEPNDPWSHNMLGVALMEQGRLDAAVVSYRRALDLKADIADVQHNLANVLRQLGRLDEAVACYRAAIYLNPAWAEAHNNLGVAVREQGRLEEAIGCYRRALDLRPELAEVHQNLAAALLARGDMALGWPEYEWRWKTSRMIGSRRDFAQPRWRGELGTLLIHAEQGFGDTLQFCRYGALAAARGLRVVMQVQRPLVRLLRGLAGVDLVVADDDEPPAFDFHCPMLSMPLVMGTTLATIPGAGRYLHADPGQAANWRARLVGAADNGCRIGLAWAGNPGVGSPGLAAIDRRRSLDPRLLAPLLDIGGLHFFSLQKDRSAALPVTDYMSEMSDFADTAALMENLDLVISVDTAVAHLAAALGKPVWLLNRFDPCWRWLTERSDSPWYPTMRLYRQPRAGDWGSVLAAVAHDLRGVAGGGSAALGA